MYKKHKNIINIIFGLILGTVVVLLLPDDFSMQGKVALGTVVLMIFWWVTRPVHLAVTALIPLLVNAFYSMIPMNDMLADYGSPVVLLILGASILTSSWTLHGLDKRVALKSLTLIGMSVGKQTVVWFVLAVILSAFMPNMVVAAALCPIAYAMVKYSGEEDNSSTLYILLLAVVWGAGLGGFGTPMGGAMNLVAITNIEKYTGAEFFYGDWVIRALPYLVLLSAVTLGFLLLIKKDRKVFDGSKTFYFEQLSALGRVKRAEWISLILLAAAVILAFARPLYAGILPGFKPPYVFLLLGVLSFFIKSGRDTYVMNWKYAVKNVNWGLIILFAGGLSAGGLIVDTGIAAVLAGLISGNSSLLIFIVVIVALGMFLANTSSNTAACAVLIPIVISAVSGAGNNPLPYVFLTVAACNSAFALPTSIRAVTVGYKMDTKFMFKKGIGVIAAIFTVLCAVGYIVIEAVG